MSATPPNPADPASLCQLLAGYRYSVQSEASLQDGLELVLTKHGVPFVREARLDAKNRPDFMVGSLAIEVKTKGSFADFLRQANRYLELDQVTGLIAIGTPKWMPMVPVELAGKPLYTVRLLNSLI